MADATRDRGATGRTPRRLLSDEQRLAWLRLLRTENVGPVTFRDLINHFGGAAAAIEALPELSLRGGRGRPVRVFSAAEAEDEMALAARFGARLVALGEPGYPPFLAAVDVPPPLLYVKGIADLLERPPVAIVGARNGSAIGQKFTRMVADALGREGYVIVSGLARGIDTAAHAAALERGTVAVLAGGIDIVYPPENAALHAAIADRGLLISERPPGFQPRGKDFPRRNRLISGMAAGVIVVEAARRSGSLITARLAAEQGREVFAVPGNPLDPRAEGTNRLLKDGANLLTCAEDVIEVLAPILGRRAPVWRGEMEAPHPLPPPPPIASSDRARVLDALSLAPVDIDEVIRAAGLPARTVHVILLELDLAGRLSRHGRQLVSLRHPAEGDEPS